jgi:hypothetical protein
LRFGRCRNGVVRALDRKLVFGAVVEPDGEGDRVVDVLERGIAEIYGVDVLDDAPEVRIRARPWFMMSKLWTSRPYASLRGQLSSSVARTSNGTTSGWASKWWRLNMAPISPPRTSQIRNVEERQRRPGS